MRAVQLTAHGAPGVFKVVNLPDPKPRPDEVVLQVQACGLNRLDLWLEEGALPIPVTLPRIPGCEVAGTILMAGDQVMGWQPDDRVVAASNLFCGGCEFCARGEESLCHRSQILGVERDGGFAEKVCLPGRVLTRIPEGVDFQAAAGLALAGSTAMHMLTNRAQVRPGEWVLVMGASSGVGSAAIQIARQLGGRVIATASTDQKRDLAFKLGAEQVVDLRQKDWPGAVREMTQKRGVDLVIEHIGGRVLEQAFDCLARGGTIVTCGATAGRQVQLQVWPFFAKQHRLIGSYSRNRADVGRTLEWAAAGKLHPVINRVFPLEETPSAYAALRDRTVLGKVIVKAN